MAIMVNLVVCRGPATGKRVPATHSHFVVGREPPADLVLEDPKATMAHLQLLLERDQVQLVNLDGRLFVNRERVEKATLHDHDCITVGDSDIEVCITPSMPTPPAPPKEQGVVTLPLAVVPAVALASATAGSPAPTRTDERVSLAEIELFHLGDSMYDVP
jgi:hypothetical protein